MLTLYSATLKVQHYSLKPRLYTKQLLIDKANLSTSNYSL